MPALSFPTRQRQICRFAPQPIFGRATREPNGGVVPANATLAVLRQLPSLLFVLICAGVPAAILLGL